MSLPLIPFGVFGGSTPASIVYTDNDVGGFDANHSFTGLAAGEEAGNRYIIVALGGTRASVTYQIYAEVEINGTPATEIIQRHHVASGWTVHSSLHCLLVPTGSTVDVDVSLLRVGLGTAGPLERTGIAIGAAYNLKSITPLATVGSGSRPSTLDVNALKGGIVVGTAVSGSSASDDHSWTGLTKQSAFFLGLNIRMSWADANVADSESPRAVSWTASGTPDFQGSCAASFR